jgi:hypothetical protein
VQCTRSEREVAISYTKARDTQQCLSQTILGRKDYKADLNTGTVQKFGGLHGNFLIPLWLKGPVLDGRREDDLTID